MSVIHMETDQVDQLGRNVIHIADHIENTKRDFDHVRNTLASSWSGGKSGEFRENLRASSRRVESLAGELRMLGTLVNREAEEWVQADADFGRQESIYGGILPWIPDGLEAFLGTWPLLSILSPGLAIAGAGALVLGTPLSGSLDWDKIIKDFVGDKLEDVVDDAVVFGSAWLYKKPIITWFKNIGGNLGRTLNTFFETRGFVTPFKEIFGDAGRFIKNDLLGNIKNIDKVGNAAGFGIGMGIGDFIGGLIDGEDPGTAAASGAITGAIFGGAAYFIPGIGQAMLISSGIQLIGTGAAIGLDALGFHGAASLVQNTLEIIDPTRYVSEISDAVVDFFKNPSNPNLAEHWDEIARPFKEVGKAINEIGNTVNEVGNTISGWMGGLGKAFGF